MEMFKVNSSIISAIGYDGTNIEVDLLDGTKYKYFTVPQSVFVKLLNTQSKGTYWNKYIKPFYPCRRLF